MKCPICDNSLSWRYVVDPTHYNRFAKYTESGEPSGYRRLYYCEECLTYWLSDEGELEMCEDSALIEQDRRFPKFRRAEYADEEWESLEDEAEAEYPIVYTIKDLQQRYGIEFERALGDILAGKAVFIFHLYRLLHGHEEPEREVILELDRQPAEQGIEVLYLWDSEYLEQLSIGAI